MAVLLSTKASSMSAWADALRSVDPTLDVRLFPETGCPDEIEVAAVWTSHDLSDLRRYPRLRLLVSMGAGVDHLLRSPGPPPGIPVVRLVDDKLTQAMVHWVLLNVLRFHRQDPEYRAQQQRHAWAELPAPDAGSPRVVGILGLGELGSAAAAALRAVGGFTVVGWSRRPKELPSVECYSGSDGLDSMLPRCHFLVCLLPLTPETRGVICARTLAMLPRGAFVLNAARGAHVVASDLLAALDSGHIGGAALDVFEPEPLPASDPLWAHPRVVITPHAASLTVPASAAPQVVENIRRLRSGRPLINVVDLKAGY